MDGWWGAFLLGAGGTIVEPSFAPPEPLPGATSRGAELLGGTEKSW